MLLDTGSTPAIGGGASFCSHPYFSQYNKGRRESRKIMSEITVTVPLTFPEVRVRDLFCSAWEGGSAYWCRLKKRIVPPAARKLIEAEKKAKGDFFDHEYPFIPGVQVVLEDATDEDTGLLWILTREALISGLEVMAKKYPQQFVDFVAENDDAETADTFLQCALFGEAVF